ncbi:MAG: alpha/beta fold hydrolase [Solirubrobacteraceae bacterium]
MSIPFTPQHRGGSGEPLVCLHGFTDSWRPWELVLPALQRERDVLALTLAGHAGGPPLPDPMSRSALADAVERAMDDAGLRTAHIVGNSLGGHLALQLAARGRARSVVALAPAGGWAAEDPNFADTLRFFVMIRDLLQTAAPRADQIVSTPEGMRRATEFSVAHPEHIPPELIAHSMRAAAACDATLPYVEFARRHGWELDAERIACPVLVAWGTADRVLPWPAAAVRYRDEWLPDADWVTLDGVGHCPQLDVPGPTAELILGFTAGRPLPPTARR